MVYPMNWFILSFLLPLLMHFEITTLPSNLSSNTEKMMNFCLISTVKWNW